MFRLRPLLAMVLLACASFARADTLRLAAPTAGTTLRGGSFAELRWSASQLPNGTEEWEAFLSIDGGRYYAFRVTPHLEIDLQHYTFVVPNVDTRNARLLIRTGNEVRETLYEMPWTFAIERDAAAAQPLPRLLQSGRGEAAREGDPAVLWWATGAALQSSPAVPHRSLHSRARSEHGAPIVVTPSAKPVAIVSLESTPLVVRDRQSSETSLPALSPDLLLVCRRRNI
jgi:hypothetical protein